MPLTVVAFTVVAVVDPTPPEHDALRLSVWFARIPYLALMYALVDSIKDLWLSRSISPFKLLLILTRLL